MKGQKNMEFTKNITIETLKNFAKDTNKNQLAIDRATNVYILSKIQINDDITIIYTTNYFYKCLKTNSIVVDENIIDNTAKSEKIGFYNFKDDSLYDLTYLAYVNFRIENEEVKAKSKTTEKTKENIRKEIKNKVLELIDNNVDNVPCTESGLSKENKEYLEEFKKYYLTEEIQRKFFEDKEQVTLEDYIYEKGINDFSVITYITLKDTQEKESYILQKAKEYITENKEDLYVCFVKIELINNGLKKLYEDKGNILHKRKLISEICKDKKTVNVTILKNDIELTFKTDTATLKNKYNTWYNDLDIQAKDRQKYKELFKHYNYTADDIREIRYSGKTIYQRKEI